MVDIEQLHIHLPVGMAHRAQTIAQLTGQRLSELVAQRHITNNLAIEQLNIGNLAVHQAYSDAQIANTIATAINKNINQQLGRTQ